VFSDDASGATVTQWTAHPAMHHHFYFTNPTMSGDGSTLFGVTYRFRYPNLMAIDTASGEIRMLTDEDDINAFSPAPDQRGAHIFYSARDEVRCVETATGRTQVLCRFAGGALGNCSLSHDDKCLAVSHRSSTCRLMLVEVATGRVRCVVAKEEVGHIQFRPGDATTLEYSGPPGARIWTVRADGGDDRLLYHQRAGEWIVHESWSESGEEIIFTHWPHALRAVHFETGNVRTIAEVNAWHARSGPNDMIVCDTNHPDRGLLLINAATGAWRVLCQPNASNQGTQWRESTPASGAGIDTSILRGPHPAADPAPHPGMPASTYGPQWTHPHPTFSPDGQSVIFTSDRAATHGWSQIYSVSRALS
jgi:oligogalacturonide lyase